METEENLVVDGYHFLTKEDAHMAKSELDRIAILEKRMDINSISQVQAVYEKAIRERIFKTPVGYNFLRKLQMILLDSGLEQEQILKIPFYISFQTSVRERSNPTRSRIVSDEKKNVEKPKKDNHGLFYSVLLNILLVLAVIGMYSIALKSDNPNILNYENALINKYSDWSQELTERENIVREKERQLKINE